MIPKPESLSLLDGRFVLSESARITCGEPDGRKGAEGLARWLRRWTELAWPTTLDERPSQCGIHFSTKGADPELGAEGYELLVTPTGVVVRAPTEAGLFYGCLLYTS
ncbi:MAG: glycoside hydrolase family 20 zincin-like fold domain-containing protein, partial [Fimbriimonadales bacterium]|nr:glycoside hydrolase family 20 zincin-like fold domain-containing protein [Fimbriimonadales bacterium]